MAYKSFEELEVWKLGCRLAVRVYAGGGTAPSYLFSIPANRKIPDLTPILRDILTICI